MSFPGNPQNGVPEILVVDDSPADLKFLTDMLQREGYKIRAASEGSLSLRSIEAKIPTLILLDIKMPGMNGYDVCAALKSSPDTSSIPIIFISGLGDESDKVRGFQAGGVDYISKPFNKDEVLARVRTHVMLRIMQMNLEDEVRRRTAEILDTNVKLQNEIEGKIKLEAILRKKEEITRILMNGIPESAILISPEGVVLAANTTVAQRFHTTVEALLGKSIYDHIDKPVETYRRNFVQQVIDTRQRVRFEDIRDERTIDNILTPIIDENGNVTQIAVLGFDITERNTTEEMLRDAQRHESIGILAGGIAHDFNNLLGVMLGNVTLAQTHIPPSHPAALNIERTLTAIERAAHLTGQMLAYSGKGKFQIRTIDLGAAVQEHVSLFSASLAKNVTLVTHLPSTPILINGDPAQIEQIIMNLIINGGDAIGDKRGLVTISLSAAAMNAESLVQFSRITRSTLAEGNYALLEVADNGIGMSKETAAKIFDPFFTTKFTGRGLGLSAVLGIIKGHKGGVMVESVPGVGTTFRLILPAMDAPQCADTAEAGVRCNGVQATTTILVIDDEEEIAAMAQEILETRHYRTLMALDPLLGIELYKEHRIEIGAVLLDLTMPKMSGKEVADVLQAIDPNVRIIISSGYSEEEVTKQMGTAKVSAFIQKPYSVRALAAKVEGAMR